jgi:hypothetical protein
MSPFYVVIYNYLRIIAMRLLLYIYVGLMDRKQLTMLKSMIVH